MVTIVDNTNTDPYFNLAMEEYIFNHAQQGNRYIMLWRNRPSVIVGKNQNTFAEVNRSVIEKNNIEVVRRMSGGGAVFHDLGNLNYTIIDTEFDGEPFAFGKYTGFIADTLSSLGVKAELSGRNDLLIDGKKFSGNAQYFSGNKLLHHGTLLFYTDLDVLTEVLTPPDCKFESKGITSVRSRVTNLIDVLPDNLTLSQFSSLLLAEIKRGKESSVFSFTETELKEVERLAYSKYQQWEWNYGLSPVANIIKYGTFPDGKLQIHLNIQNGIIQSIKFYGDFFTFQDLTEIEPNLVNCRYQYLDLKARLEDIMQEDYVKGISREQILECLIC